MRSWHALCAAQQRQLPLARSSNCMTYDFFVNCAICQKLKLELAEFVKKFGLLCDEALARPVIITRHGRDRLVVMSLAMYRGLGGAPDLAKQADGEHSVRPSGRSGRKRGAGRRPPLNR